MVCLRKRRATVPDDALTGVGDSNLPALAFHELSPDELRRETAASWPPPVVDMLLAAWEAAVRHPAYVTTTVADLVVAAVRFAATSRYPMVRLLEDVAAILPDSQVRDRLVKYAAFGGDVEPADIGQTWGSSGFVADSVPLALFSARAIGERPFAAIVGGAIAAGGDTDTVGSITGQIAGAALGMSAAAADRR